MLTGQRAFGGDDIAETLANVINKEPPWDALAPAIPSRVRQVLHGCLQKHPKQRLDSAQSVRLALDGLFETAAPPAAAASPAMRPLWRRALPLAGTAMATALPPSSTL